MKLSELKTQWYEGIGVDIGRAVTIYDFLSSYDASLSYLSSALPQSVVVKLTAKVTSIVANKYIPATKGVEIPVPSDFMALYAVRAPLNGGTYDARLVTVGAFFEMHSTTRDPVSCLNGDRVIINKIFQAGTGDLGDVPTMVYKRFPSMLGQSEPDDWDIQPDIDERWHNVLMRYTVANTMLRYDKYNDAAEILKAIPTEISMMLQETPREVWR